MKRLRQRNDLTTFPRTHNQEVRESPFELKQSGPQVHGLVMHVLLCGSLAVIYKQTSIQIDIAFQDILKLIFFFFFSVWGSAPPRQGGKKKDFFQFYWSQYMTPKSSERYLWWSLFYRFWGSEWLSQSHIMRIWRKVCWLFMFFQLCGCGLPPHLYLQTSLSFWKKSLNFLGFFPPKSWMGEKTLRRFDRK